MDTAEDIVEGLALASAQFLATHSLPARRALRREIDRFNKYKAQRNLTAAAARADRARAEQPGYRADLEG